MADDSAAYQNSVPGTDRRFPGKGGSLETDPGSVDIDAVAFAGVHNFRVAGHNGYAGFFRFFCDRFDRLGYRYEEALSDEGEYIFLKKEQDGDCHGYKKYI